jgi:hypothetical protein
MNLSDPQTCREMAAALRDLAIRTHRPGGLERLCGLAARLERMAEQIEHQAINDNSLESDLGEMQRRSLTTPYF